MIVKNPIGLIGDTLGTFPVLQQLNKDHEHFSVIVLEEVKWLYELVPELKLCECSRHDKELNISGAFTLSHAHGLYMTAAHYPFMGLPIPEQPEKAALTVKPVDVPVFDYIIAPYGRSAPEEQKLQLHKWYELAELMPDKTFCIIGNSKHDAKWGEEPKNVTFKFDCEIHELCNLLCMAEHGCISIVTGISHLCYHLGVKNYLLANQAMTWGIQPNAIVIDKYIPTITAKDIYDRITT